jgi:hypothetical protein
MSAYRERLGMTSEHLAYVQDRIMVISLQK